VGGIREEVPAGWADRVRRAVADVRRRLPDLENLIRDNEIFLARTRGVGVLSAADVLAYGVSGPIGRASGVDFDLRRDEPYLAYGELTDVLRVVTGTAGDCHTRFVALLDQVHASLDLADACLDRLPGGPSASGCPRRSRCRRARPTSGPRTRSG